MSPLLEGQNGCVLAAVDGVDSACREGALHVLQYRFAAGFAVGSELVEPGGGGRVCAVGIQRNFRPAEGVDRVLVLLCEGPPLPLVEDEAPGARLALGDVGEQHFLLLGGVADLPGLGHHRLPVGLREDGHERQPELPSRQPRLLFEEDLEAVRAVGFGVVENSGSTIEGQLPVSCISAAVLAVNAKSPAVTSLPSLHFTPSISSTSVAQSVSPSTTTSSRGVGKSTASDGTQSYLWAEYA